MEIFKQQAYVVIDETCIKAGSGRTTPQVSQDFSEVASLTDQHSIHTNDLNVLVARYTPDELTNYLLAKQTRRPIEGHDFSKEPSYQDALNEVNRIKKVFLDLPHEVQSQFKSPMDFVKFVDNPHNVDRLVEMKLLERVDLTPPQPQQTTTTNQTTTTTTETPKS